jgi:hypothetical protein
MTINIKYHVRVECIRGCLCEMWHFPSGEEPTPLDLVEYDPVFVNKGSVR